MVKVSVKELGARAYEVTTARAVVRVTAASRAEAARKALVALLTGGAS